MNKIFENAILKSTGATGLKEGELIQSLWSGYGKILRYSLIGSSHKTLVVKHVKLPESNSHKYAWGTNLSHKRKLKSYEVEMAFYKNFAQKCDESCRVPFCFAQEIEGDETLMVLEDLNEVGFEERRRSVSLTEIEAVLKWLANFHAVFMFEVPKDLWEVGTYWHLETRPDELEVLDDFPLKEVAKDIDEILKKSPFQTLVHGDAKLANFCFSKDGERVAGVDFQYVGGGCGMKDVAYFVGSCLNENSCEKYEKELLEIYFSELETAVKKHNCQLNFEDLKENWTEMYHYAWTDFHRFLKGWSPSHWKINTYSEKVSRSIIQKIKRG